MSKLKEDSVLKIAKALTSFISIESKAKYRETCGLALKSIIRSAKEDQQEKLSNFLVQELTKGIKQVSLIFFF